MIDERQLIEIAVSDVAQSDPSAMERARSILQAQMREISPAPSRRRIPRARWLVAAAVVAAVVLAIRAILPGPESAAAKELHRLAAVAKTRTALDISGGRYLYTRFEASLANGIQTPIGSITYLVRERIENWRASDGSGLVIETISSVTPADPARWEAAGEPKLPRVRTKTTSYNPGELGLFNLSDLPTDPEALEPILRSGRILEQSPAQGATTGKLGASIGELLIQGDASPALRGALFEVMAGLPGVSLDSPQTDHLGREGVGLSFVDGVYESTYIFDPATAELLEFQERLFRDGILLSTSWQDPTATAVVDAAGERP